MRVIFVNPPKIIKYLILIISKFYKKKYFINQDDLKLNSFLITNNIQPLDFSGIKSKEMYKYIFGNKELYNHTKSFFFKNYPNFFKKSFSNSLDKKSIVLLKLTSLNTIKLLHQ